MGKRNAKSLDEGGKLWLH